MSLAFALRAWRRRGDLVRRQQRPLSAWRKRTLPRRAFRPVAEALEERNAAGSLLSQLGLPLLPTFFPVLEALGEALTAPAVVGTSVRTIGEGYGEPQAGDRSATTATSEQLMPDEKGAPAALSASAAGERGPAGGEGEGEGARSDRPAARAEGGSGNSGSAARGGPEGAARGKDGLVSDEDLWASDETDAARTLTGGGSPGDVAAVGHSVPATDLAFASMVSRPGESAFAGTGMSLAGAPGGTDSTLAPLSPGGALLLGTFAGASPAVDGGERAGLVHPVAHTDTPPFYRDPTLFSGYDGSSSLQRLYNQYNSLAMSGMPPSQIFQQPQLADLKRMLTLDTSAGKVLVNLRVKAGNSLTTMQTFAQNNLSFSPTVVTTSQDLVTGWLPIPKLNYLPGVPGFGAVTPVYKPIYRTGSVTTEGDAVMGTNLVRSTVGVSGQGVTVGVLSDTVNQVNGGIAASQRTGDLPATVTVLQDGPAAGATDEGRAMLEVIDDVAPGARLAFNTGWGGPQAMAQGINNLASAGAKVIVDDVTYPNEPFFNDGVLAKAVDHVSAANDVTYVTAAGNEANHAWSSTFISAPANVAGLSGLWENFSGSPTTPGVLQHLHLDPGQTLDLAFQWDQAFLEGGTNARAYQVLNNLDIYLTDAQGTRIYASSTDDNMNTDEAMERLVFTNPGTGVNDYALAIRFVGGPQPGKIKWVRFDNNPIDQGIAAPTIFGHAGAASALTVGAAPASNPTQADAVTSRGPVTILFDENGWAVSRPIVRNNKPSLVAPDAVTTTVFGAQRFTGTSAAAAHAAGVAALLRQQNPSQPGAVIHELVEQSTTDIGAVGRDPVTGLGAIRVAPQGALAPAAPPAWQGTTTTRAQDPGVFAFASTTHTVGLNEAEESVAVDPTNNDNVFMAGNVDVNTQPGLFLSVSHDGGVTWSPRLIANGSDAFKTACCDPSAFYDQFGNLFLDYISFSTDTAVLLMSTDAGNSFTQLGTFAATDQPKLTTGPGGVWMVWNNGTDLQMVGLPVFGKGLLGSFTALESPPGPIIGERNFGKISIGPSGQVMISWQDATTGEGPDKIFVSVDPDGFGPAGLQNQVLVTNTNVGSFATPLVQPDRMVDAESEPAFDRSGGQFNGRVYIVYTDRSSVTSQDFTINIRHSDDNGQTWSAPTQVDNPRHVNQVLPRIRVDQTDGDVAVTWYDANNDLGSGPGDLNGVPNDEPEMFGTLSFDGGNTWEPSIQISKSASSAIIDPDGGFDFGDYTGLDFTGGFFYPAWADNSLTLPGNPDAPNSMDIAVAKVGAELHPPEDAFESNETTDTATNRGTLSGTDHIGGLTLAKHANGLYDYDVFKYTMGVAGTFTAKETEEASRGGIELHVFKQVGNTLVQLGQDQVRRHFVKTVSASVNAGDVIYVQVKGINYARGRMGTGFYHLDDSLV